MTELSLARLCAFSYLSLPSSLRERLPVRLSLAARVLQQSPLSDESARLLCALSDTLETAALMLVEAPENPASGFAACVLRSGQGQHIAVMRGSDSSGCAAHVDWIDNIAAPLLGSRQYADIEALLRHYPAGPLLFTGHSKGGHNALWALAHSPNALARAAVFNAQGFARRQLSPAQRERLRLRGVNYVTRGDLVGRLLSHPERRVDVCSCPYTGADGGMKVAHRLGSLCFDSCGGLIYCQRQNS